jgi:hypothetical protein
MLAPAERSKYLGSHDVWSEIKSVYDEYLKHYPTDNEARKHGEGRLTAIGDLIH